MRKYLAVASGALLSTTLAVAGCSSNDTTTSSPATSASAQQGGRPGGPGGGGPGGGMGQVTAVNLNTNGVSPGGANTAAVVAATNAFLATLDATTKDKVQYDFTENKARQTWSNFPTTTVPREGIVMSALTAGQQKAADAMLAAALSTTGAQQDSNIRASDDELNRLGGQGADGFGSLTDYYVAVYGTPSATSPFMIQFGGHHLARNLTYNGDKVSQTPQFVGTEPTSFTAGGTTVEPLKAESTAMFGMLSGITAAHKTAAKITSGTFDDLVMGPGKDTGVYPASEGVAVSELSADEKKLVTTAIQTYVGDLADAAAAKLMAKYTAELDQTRIGWSNNSGPTDENSYVRIDGPSVWIEFINTRSQSTPNIHFHSVYRDKTNDYGSTKPS
ncbi:DUF3500 domain-containing protein [Winogradskya humida]|uniref:DUF3500 domain-containing protein n=1 Tax=Winogradskya humida TaxID=113566 RepID=A0ABQ4A6E0_9ACTN|nr:DUF3500 domain-containing protein [Actinoplanes humidus]GIE26383.1 hypothetical protein Ahu01nite_094850 [Actinoplanes humidus]